MPSDNILDSGIYDKNDIFKALKRADFHRHYEMDSGEIIVEQTETIKVSINYRSGALSVKPLAPPLGNGPQILASIVLLAASFILSLPGPWVIGILGGWLFSRFWYRAKTKKLQMQVQLALKDENKVD